MTSFRALLFSVLFLTLLSPAQTSNIPESGPTPIHLDEPYATPSATNFSKLIGWPKGAKPQAPPGFEVQAFASELDYPRWIYVLPNGDVLVAEARTELKGLSANNRTEGGGPAKPQDAAVSHMVSA